MSEDKKIIYKGEGCELVIQEDGDPAFRLDEGYKATRFDFFWLEDEVKSAREAYDEYLERGK